MALYITQDDLIARFGAQQLLELSDRESAGQIDAARVAQAIADTCARIDGYLASRYPLPLATVPQAIPPLASDICRYILAERPTDEMRKRYDDALAWFAKVAEGKFGLGLDQTSQPVPEAPVGGPQFVARNKTHMGERLGDFVDPPLWP